MLKNFDVAVRLTVVTLVLTGLAYPLAVTGIAQSLLPHRANGSLVAVDVRRVVGSEWIGQPFSDPAYFHPRPSAARRPYDAAASSGSNLGPTSAQLRERVAEDARRLRAQNPGARGPLPDDLLTASASGLDPHISPAAAAWQVPRVALARGVEESRVAAVVAGRTEPRQFGFLGDPRVNVLLLNLALDRELGRPVPAPAR